MKTILLILYLILLLKCGGYEDPCACLDPIYLKSPKLIQNLIQKQTGSSNGVFPANIDRLDSNLFRISCPIIYGGRWVNTKFVYTDANYNSDSLYIDSIVYSIGEKCRHYRYFYYTLAKNQQTYENDTIVLF